MAYLGLIQLDNISISWAEGENVGGKKMMEMTLVEGRPEEGGESVREKFTKTTIPLAQMVKLVTNNLRAAVLSEALDGLDETLNKVRAKMKKKGGEAKEGDDRNTLSGNNVNPPEPKRTELETIMRERDKLSDDEWDTLLEQMKERLDAGDDPETILSEECGLEPDYVFDLIELVG